MIRFLVFLLISNFAAATAHADIVNDFIRIDCNKQLNYLSIESFGVNGWLPANNAKRKKDMLFKEHGIIDLMSLFEFSSDSKLQTPLTFETSCILDTLDDPDKNQTHEPKYSKYDIKLKGFAENSNPGGSCGGWRSYSVTIKKDGITIVDDVPYEFHCGDDLVLGNISVNPHEGYLHAGNKFSLKTLWWDEDLPVTIDKIYNPENEKK